MFRVNLPTIALAALLAQPVGLAFAQDNTQTPPTQQPPAPAAPTTPAPSMTTPSPSTAAPSTGAPTSTAQHGHRLTLDQLFANANTTHDGHLTKDQAKTARWNAVYRNFDAIDSQKKGYVTVDDIKAYRAAHRTHKTKTMTPGTTAPSTPSAPSTSAPSPTPPSTNE